MSGPAGTAKGPAPPLWRQAFDVAERVVAPRAQDVVRSEYFSLGVALARRARVLARGSIQDLTARAWRVVNLPSGSDVSRLRAQIGALDREVRRLTIQLESERRSARPRSTTPAQRGAPTPEDSNADGAQPADGARPRPAGRRTQRPAGT
jgi:hypothetical protein